MADITNASYLELISTAINDFDKIYTQLYNKGVSSGGSVVPQPTTTGIDSGISTSSYATLISDQLFRVGNLTSSGLSLSDGKIVDRTAGSVATTGTVNYTEKKITLTGVGAGYYNTTSPITYTIADNSLINLSSIDSYTLTETKTGDTTVYGPYVYTPAEGKFISSVTITKGMLNVAAPTITFNAGWTNTLTNTITSNESSISFSETTPTDATKYYAIGITPKSELSGNVSAANNVTLTEGYIKDDNASDKKHYTKIDSGSSNLSALNATGNANTYYIPKGSLSDIKSTSTITIDNGEIQLVETGATSSNSYDITASAANATISGKITEGYLKANDTLSGTATSIPATIHVKKGSIANFTHDVSITVDTSNVATATSDYVNVPISFNYGPGNTNTKTNVITEGYIKSTNVTSTINGTNTELHLKKGSATVIKGNDANIVYSGDTSILGTGKSGKTLTLTITPNTTISNFSAGYFSEASQITAGNIGTTSVTVGIDNGTVSTSNSIATSLTERTDDGDGSSKENDQTVNIFLSAAPSSGDYYDISATARTTVTPGYVDSAPANSTVHTYLPKAKVRWVDTGEGGEDYLEVSTGGYLPAGIISNITTAVIQNAKLLATLSNSNVLTSIASGEDLPAGAYEISISKNGSSDAGYISATQGTLSLDNKYYVAHGSITNTASLGNISLGTDAIKLNDTNNSYAIPVTVSGTLSNKFVEGYIKTTDVTNNSTGNQGNSTFSKTNTINIDKATFEVKNANIAISSTGTGIETSSTATSYYVTPTISSDKNTATISVKSAGYIATGNDQTVTIAAATDDITPTYIKAGAGWTSTGSTGSGTAKIKNNLNSTVSGDYTIELDGTNTINTTGTLQAGYYGATEINALKAGIATVSGLTGSTTIAHGSLTTSGSASANIVTDVNNITFVSGVTTSNASNYYSLTTSITNTSISKELTEGYIKNADITGDTIINTNSDKYYIGKYSATTGARSIVSGNETDTDTIYLPFGTNGFGVDSDGAAYDGNVIAIAEKYSKKDIGITLHENAMGSNVRSKLAALQARLAGQNAKSIV